MRILVISYHYFPINNPRSFRWTDICSFWAGNGILVDVVCAGSKHIATELNQVEGINVCFAADLSTRFHVVPPTENPLAGSSKYGLKGKIKCFILQTLKKITLFLRWPDHAWLWIFPAYSQVTQLLKSNHYDGIISVASPFSSHIVAFMLGKKRGVIPWVCDYGDPFSCMQELSVNNKWLYGWLNKYIEARINGNSQKVSVTTLEAVNEYTQIMGLPKQWFHIIPPLAKKNFNVIANCKNKIPMEQSINLIFAGVLYAKIRNPGYCLKLLSAVKTKILPCKLQVHFYGNIEECKQEFKSFQSNMNEWIFLHGSITQSELIKIYEKAHIAINIGNSTFNQVPSKVIEYMSTGLPILNITSIPNDSSISLLKNYPAQLTLCQRDGITEKTIEELGFFLLNSERVNSQKIKDILKKYQIEEISQAYIDLMFQEK